MRRFAVVLALMAAAAFASLDRAQAQTPATAAAPATGAAAGNDALSIEANLRYLEENKKKKGVIVRPSGLQFRIIQNGYGKRPTAADSVTVYYTGTLINNVIFDGTSPGLPATFRVQAVVPGWIEALQLMREGDRWQLTIPPNLGYGVRGAGNGAIPPNQTLLFDIRLVKVTVPPKPGEKGYVPDPADQQQ